MKNLNNERGSILVITTAFILIFTMLGFAAIHSAGVQNDWAEKQRASDEAFWLADGAVQVALEKLRRGTPVLIPQSDPPVSLATNNVGNARSYDVYSQADPSAVHRWNVESTATVNNKTRQIHAEIADYDITDAITTDQIVNGGTPDCEGPGPDQITGICEQKAVFSFESVFNGKPLSYFKTNAARTYTDPPNAAAVDPIVDITVINLVSKNKVTITSTNMTSSAAFLIIDGSAAGSKVTVTINGATDFRGIIWVIGPADVLGNTNIVGSLFIDAPPGSDSKFSGSGKITFDKDAVDDAVDTVPQTPYIVAWKEI